MNIAFWDNQLCERGSTTSLYDYAFYNQSILGNISFIFYDKNRHNNSKKIIEKFKKEFIVHETDNFKEVDDYLLKYKITHIYIIKAGENDSRLSNVAKNCIHCVFRCLKPHGDVYASISSNVNGYNKKIPIVPHMINLPKNNENLRKILNIPDNSVVFGGYGGKDSFDIKFVHEVIYNVAKNNKNIYFLFANFNKFCDKLDNIIHLPVIIELDDKVRFINSCDAMIWGRSLGETFGLAIGEFSTMNKPIIATKNTRDKAHVNFLGNKGIWYSDEKNLTNILINFDPEIEKKKDWKCYQEYTPEKIMNIFKNIFLI